MIDAYLLILMTIDSAIEALAQLVARACEGI